MRRIVAALLVSIAPVVASAKPLLPGPGDAAHDGALAKLAAGYQRQQDAFATVELGLSLNPWVKPGDLPLVRDFFSQEAIADFQAFAKKHPFEVLERFDEHEDLGNFGGVASVGVAARLLALRAQGAPSDEIARARDAVVRAARAWIVFGSIGGRGVVVRGLRRTKPLDPKAPPLPGSIPPVVPLSEPAKKTPTWRAPVADGFDGWIWIDDTSKDQVIGYALATAWLWDALKSDPEAPPGLADELARPLADFARALMKIAPETGVDMCIRDADGRLTSFYDLNARFITSGGKPLPEDSTLLNGFNAALGLAVVRAAHHVSSDPEIGRYYYEELVGRRDWPGAVAKNAGAIFVGSRTNYSNVNMLAMALAVLGRFERDVRVRETLARAFEKQFWSVGNDRDASSVGQAWYDVIYAAYGAKAPADVRARVTASLGGFQPAPAMQRERINCDEGEIAKGSCLAIDGKTTLVLSSVAGHNGIVVAKDPVPMAVRPDSDMAWRGDPHGVNLGGSNRMNPGGDFLAAYWLARVTDVDEPFRNLSPFGPQPLPWEAPDDAGASDGGARATDEAASGGCGCRASPRAPSWSALALAALLLRRRRA